VQQALVLMVMPRSLLIEGSARAWVLCRWATHAKNSPRFMGIARLLLSPSRWASDRRTQAGITAADTVAWLRRICHAVRRRGQCGAWRALHSISGTLHLQSDLGCRPLALQCCAVVLGTRWAMLAALGTYRRPVTVSLPDGPR
jgi:hypothetical protein